MNNFERIKQMNIDEMENIIHYLHFLIFMGAGGFNLRKWLESENYTSQEAR